MSVITKLLAVTLGLRCIRNDVIAVDGKPQAAVGMVEEILIVIIDVQTYIPL